MARNGAAYDNKLSLQWCAKHGLNPDMIITQDSIITYMHFKNKQINTTVVDTLYVFNEGLRTLPAIFGSKETVK